MLGAGSDADVGVVGEHAVDPEPEELADLRFEVPDPGRPLDVRRSSPEAGDVSHTAADSTRAREELGFAPATSFSEGLRAEYEWVRRRVEAEPEKALRKAG